MDGRSALLFNEKLESIMKRMARWYGIEVCYADLGIWNYTLQECTFSTDIEKVFDILSSLPFGFFFRKGKVLISRSKNRILSK
ncbi:MAG: DUF4974 domain-containing protein [Butyricimonas faecihominis]